MADQRDTRDWRHAEDNQAGEHHGGAEHGYGQGGRTAYGQMANGGSDMGGRGFGGANAGGFGQQTQNSQWGQGGMGPMTQGANYSQGGGRFGPAGYDRSSDRTGYGSHDSHRSDDRRDDRDRQGDDYGRGRMDRDRFARSDYGPSGQTPYGSSEERGYGQNVFDRGDLAQPSRSGPSGQSPYGSSQAQGYGQNRASGFGGDDPRFDSRTQRADNPADYGRGGGSYGQQDYAAGAQRSNFRIDQHSSQHDAARDDRRGRDEDHEPHYRTWRDSQLAAHDQDYARWRGEQARKYDEDYRGWRNERHSTFTKEFEGWRSGLGGQAGGQAGGQGGAQPQASYGQGLSGASHTATQGVGAGALQSDAATAATSPVVAPESTPISGSTTAAATGSQGERPATDDRTAVDSTLVHGANPTLGAIADGTTGSHRDLPHADREERKEEEKADHSA